MERPSLRRYEYSFPSLGTNCSISIFAWSDDGLDAIISSACTQIVGFDGVFSRFRKDSILSRLNSEKTFSVGNDFLDLLIRSKEIFLRTKGYFNPLSNIRTYGYTENFEDARHFSLQEIPEDLDMNAIEIQDGIVTLRAAMNLDFGAIGKGYIADRIGEFLEQEGLSNFIVNLGGDIVIRGVTEKNELPRIGIVSPDLVGFSASISVNNASVSTSGTYLRNWEINGKAYHHIKTPGEPTQESLLSSITIVARKGYESDALATAVFAMGIDRGMEFCLQENIDALFLLKSGEMRFTKGFDERYDLMPKILSH